MAGIGTRAPTTTTRLAHGGAHGTPAASAASAARRGPPAPQSTRERSAPAAPGPPAPASWPPPSSPCPPFPPVWRRWAARAGTQIKRVALWQRIGKGGKCRHNRLEASFGCGAGFGLTFRPLKQTTENPGMKRLITKCSPWRVSILGGGG